MNSTHEPGDVSALSGIDLNLLVALDALLGEQNVTRAAARVGVTQSAMSHTLRRLRGLFNDALLVRGPGGMLPTPRAEALTIPVRAALLACGRAFGPPAAFDPATAKRRFKLAAPDIFELVVGPSLLAHVEERAPHVDLTCVDSLRTAPDDALITGELDVAIVVVQPGVNQGGAAGLIRKTLFHDEMCVFGRAGHPALSEPLTASRYAALKHILVSPKGEGPGWMDGLLAEQDLERRIAYRTAHFYVAAAIAATSQLVLTAPGALARMPGLLKLAQQPLPFALPNHGIALMWHERFTDDAAHRWLRDQVAEVSERVGVNASLSTG